MSLKTFWEQPPLHVCIHNFLPDTFDYSEVEALSRRLESLDVAELTEKEMRGWSIHDQIGAKQATLATLRALYEVVDRLCSHIGAVCGCECRSSGGSLKVRPYARGVITRTHTDMTYNEDDDYLERRIFISLTDASQLTLVDAQDSFMRLQEKLKGYSPISGLLPSDAFNLRDCADTRRGSAVVFDTAAVHAAPAHDDWRIVGEFGYRISATVDVATERRALCSFPFAAETSQSV